MYRTFRWLPLLAALALGACSDNGTNPVNPDDFDPVGTEQAVQDLQNSLDDDSDIMVSLGLAAETMAGAGGAAMSIDGVPTPLSAKMVSNYSMSGAAAEPVIPPELLGTVFVWNELEGHYVPSETEQVSTDRVRFILYAIDPITRMPVSPLVETGILDLIDEGDAETTRLRIYAESGGVALVNYFIDLSYALLGGNDISVTVVADGFISDGTDKLVFLLTQGATLLASTNTIDMDLVYALSLEGQDVSVTVELHGEFDLSAENPIETATVELRIQNGIEFVDFEMTLAADNTVDGVIKYGGVVVVEISGTEADPVFTKAGGEQLTLEEVAALLDLFDTIEDVLDLVEDIFEPFGGASL